MKGNCHIRSLSYAHPKRIWGTGNNGVELMLRNLTFNEIETLGEMMLALVALAVPIVTLAYFLTT